MSDIVERLRRSEESNPLARLDYMRDEMQRALDVAKAGNREGAEKILVDMLAILHEKEVSKNVDDAGRTE